LAIQEKINNRPRKKPRLETPNEAYREILILQIALAGCMLLDYAKAQGLAPHVFYE